MRRGALVYAAASCGLFLLLHDDNLTLKAAALAVLLALQLGIALRYRELRPLLFADAVITGLVSVLLIASPETFRLYRFGWLAHAAATSLLVLLPGTRIPRTRVYRGLIALSGLALPTALLALPPHFTIVDLTLTLWTLGGLPLIGAGLLGSDAPINLRLPGRALLLVAIAVGYAASIRSVQSFPNFSATDEAMIFSYMDTWKRTGIVEAGLVPYPAPTVTGSLYVYAAALWTQVFPGDPFALRNLSMLASVALLGVTFLVGRAVSDVLTGLAAAALLATNLLWLAVGHVGRQEMLLTAWVWLAVWLALAARKRGSAWLAALAGLVAALSADVHPLGALACAAMGVWWIIQDRRLDARHGNWRLLGAFILGGLAGTACYAAAHILPDPAAFFAGVRDEVFSYGSEGTTPPGAMLVRLLAYAAANPLEAGLLGVAVAASLRRREGRVITLLVAALIALYTALVADPNPYYPMLWMPGIIISAAIGLRTLRWRWRTPVLVGFAAAFAFNLALVERHIRADWNARALDAVQQVAAARASSGRGLGETFLYLGLRQPDFIGFTFINYEAAMHGVSRWDVVDKYKPDWIVTLRDDRAFSPEFSILSVDVPPMRLELPEAQLAQAYQPAETISTSVGVFEIWRRS